MAGMSFGQAFRRLFEKSGMTQAADKNQAKFSLLPAVIL